MRRPGLRRGGAGVCEVLPWCYRHRHGWGERPQSPWS
jgi:hypothetical protein